MRSELRDDIVQQGSVGYGFKQLYSDFTNTAVGYTVLNYDVALDKIEELLAQGQILDVDIPISELGSVLN